MAMTNAEKQAAYRVRKIKEGDGERLQAVISLHAKRALERLSKHQGITQAAMLERLILDEQRRVTASMDADQHRVYVGEAVTA
ncbi:MAG: RepB family protein [Gallionella sp.]|nr:RepB family protein [Pseudomonadota bacterium]MDZ4201003.1 RepB family protein [Gallionella sp.]